MSWHELHFLVPRDQAENWADACLAAGALSVEAEDADAESPDEQPLFGEPGMPVHAFGWAHTRLKILLEADTDRSALLREAAELAGSSATPAVIAEHVVEDQDWVRVTQEQYAPIPVGRQLLIAPSWRADSVADEASGRTVLIVDPGQAFGTGSHPTTRMCLEWLDAHPLAGRSVLDYGCGSGILAIAAARLGAAAVTAWDIDPRALQTTVDNAAVNRATLDVLDRARAARPPQADIVVANILSSPLMLLAPMLSACVRPGGVLVLSGILERQWREVAGCYDTIGLQVWQEREGWVCLAGSPLQNAPERVVTLR